MAEAHGRARRFLSVLVVAGAGALLSPLPSDAQFDPNANPHASFRDPATCPSCHPGVRGKTDPDRLVAGAADFCFRCHQSDSLGRSHPIGGRAQGARSVTKVPGGFPLDADGRMTCVTCHRAHGPFVATARAFPGQQPENPDAPPAAQRYYRTRYLRTTDAARGFVALCEGCHETR